MSAHLLCATVADATLNPALFRPEVHCTLFEDIGVAARVLVEQAGAALLLVLKRQVVHVFAARGQCGWRADVGAVTFRHPGREKLMDLSANAGHGEDI